LAEGGNFEKKKKTEGGERAKKKVKNSENYD